jgi:hypothetical protein
MSIYNAAAIDHTNKIIGYIRAFFNLPEISFDCSKLSAISFKVSTKFQAN